MLDKNRIAVISSGNGGQSMAAYFAHLGFSVALYAREKERVMMFPQDRVFKLRGAVVGNPVVDFISSDMSEVIKDAHLIMVTTPTQYHHVVAREMAGCLEDGQIILLNPGRTFGTYVFTGALKQNGNDKDVIVAEAETFMFACRCARVAEPYIHGIKENVRVAAHNSDNTEKVVETLRRLFPSMQPAESVLHTGFSNIGMVFHPLPILLNITRVEAQEKFLYYIDGISPLVANILDRMDNERLDVARAYGVETPSAFEWLQEHYGSEGETLYDRIQSTPAYANILAPIDIDTRYIFEDILTGCVPMYYAGAAVGVDTPIIKSAILWASTVYATDFIQNGRNDTVIDFAALLEQAEKKPNTTAGQV